MPATTYVAVSARPTMESTQAFWRIHARWPGVGSARPMADADWRRRLSRRRRDQVNAQRHANTERSAYGDQNRCGGAVFDDSNAGVDLRVQVIRQMLDCGIGQFGRYHGSARQK